MDFSKLKGKLPQNVYDELEQVVNKFQINNVNRLSHFLGQCSHESGNFKFIRENLNYSAQALANTFPTRFAIDPKAKVKVPNTLAKSIERQPQKIANTVYANRMGNGDTNSNEGWLYAGKGYIQLTGKQNYAKFDQYVNDDIIKNPDLVATKYPLLSAAFFWFNNNLNIIADNGVNNTSITNITKRVNGGTIGLEHRIKMTNYYFNLLK